MSHLITPVPATAISPIAKPNKLIFPTLHTPHHVLDDTFVHRRTLTLGLVGALLGFSVGDQKQANAAARRPPPPPPAEKKDPSVSGVQAKVLASKKRKEAMKQEVAKLREKGKPVDGSSPPSE
ncbi:Ribosomal protein L5 B isoform 1 [Hibiscus syriacus]|uniref:Ribosomal protein L5 B isoform 1 n=2 Tax=Hibiscus syriacus TaxID=106335 RepID=A0A6A3BQE7_HIBSY|nr:Ribosomal protein L5 B isoform 1 [Hibiscus syriacus]